MRRPLPLLAPGDAVAVVAPAGPVQRGHVERGLAALTALGLSPRPFPHLYDAGGYLAGMDEARAADLNAAAADPGLKGIFLARGGFGVTRVLPLLRGADWHHHPKLLLGYSDATALGLALSREQPFPYLYGPHVAELGDAEPSFDLPSLRAGLFGLHPEGRQRVAGLEVHRSGSARAVILGGCLSLIVALIGTPFECPLSGRILFLEEVNEEPYRLDRMLTHLRAAGRLDKVAGLLIGQLTGCVPRDPLRPSPSALEVVASFADAIDGPVLSGLPAGHGPGRLTVPLGVEATLDGAAGETVFHHR